MTPRAGTDSVAVRRALRALEASGRADRRRVSEWYFPTAMRVLGTPTPAIRRTLRALGTALREAPAEHVIGTAQALVDANVFEARQAAYLLLETRRDALDALRPRRIESLGRGMDNWASVDTFACSVAGRVWLAGGLSDATVMRWARSRDRWWRRAALASTVPLNLPSHGGAGDRVRTLKISRMLVGDHDDMVVKALSWALRCLVRHDAAAVRGFIARHDGVVASRVVREVRHKLATGLKNPRRRPRPGTGRRRAAHARARSGR